MTSPWLRLVRIHTASLTQGVVLIAIILAGSWVWWQLFLFVILAILFHAAGFVQNDIYDFKNDTDDPAKKHFPLVSGEISLREARIIYQSFTLLLFFLGALLCQFRLIPLIFLFTAVGLGWLYNMRSKRDIYSPIYITASLLSLYLFAFFTSSNTLPVINFLVLPFLAFLMLFQIAIEGYMKDIRSDTVSLLRKLGTRYLENDTIHVGVKTKILAWSLKIPVIILFFIIWSWSKSNWIAFVLGLFAIFIIIHSTAALLKDGRYHNRTRVRLCATIEVFTYTLLVIALQGMMEWHLLLLLVLYPYTWFLLLNRLTWGTWITPRV